MPMIIQTTRIMGRKKIHTHHGSSKNTSRRFMRVRSSP